MCESIVLNAGCADEEELRCGQRVVVALAGNIIDQGRLQSVDIEDGRYR